MDCTIVRREIMGRVILDKEGGINLKNRMDGFLEGFIMMIKATEKV